MCDLAWALARPSDHLEHLYARRHGTEMEVVVFLLAESPAAAKATVETFGQRLLSYSPLLDGWRVKEISPLKLGEDPLP
ncbi:hypothetical protein [Actinomadura rudentiformis]|uniref:Uncharacterized protein n=1 Tax=Actinomadura rudentiformis TaxID=359158 RepID=A0A6H9YLK5_9ACTN|nr:hypothetical protein [Actinomadura rudentiformis]KAB2340340.1 hypothetical protein F8566_44930 [Actinomadura rudentiformis]